MDERTELKKDTCAVTAETSKRSAADMDAAHAHTPAEIAGTPAAAVNTPAAASDRAARSIPASTGRCLGAATALYALLYTVCLYRNASGITYPFFVAGTLYYFYYCTVKCRVPSDKDRLQKVFSRTIPYAAAELLLGISVFLTADPKVHLMTKTMLFGVTLIIALMLFCRTESWNLQDFVKNGWKALFGLFGYLDTPFSDAGTALKTEEKQKENAKGHYVLIGLVAGIPLLIVVVALLLSADAVFASLASRFLGQLAWSDFIKIFLMLVLVYLFVYSFVRGLLTKELTAKKHDRFGEPLAAITVLSLLTAIYTVFCTIQIVYLFLRAGTLPEQMTWAQYARQGFFQLLAVCVINLAVVAVCLFGFRANRVLQVLLTIVCALTYVLIASSAWRMYLYICQYSLTFLRLMVLWTLLVMAVVFAGTMIAVWKPDFGLLRFWMLSVVFLYLIPAFCRPDYWIASYNIARYNIARDNISSEANAAAFSDTQPDPDDSLPTATDYSYLRGLSADAAPVLLGQKDLTGDAVLWVHAYREDMLRETKDLGIRNFNLSLWQAKRRLAQA